MRLAFGSVAPSVLRATATEQILRGSAPSAAVLEAAQETLAAEIAPIDDMRSTARYRRHVAKNLLAEFIEKLAN